MIAGIDFSTKAIDVVLIADEGHQAEWHRFQIPKHQLFTAERARAVLAAAPARGWWEDNGVWLVGIEQPMSRFAHTAKSLGLVAGALISRLPRGLPVIETQPEEWQRMFCDPGEKVCKESIARASRRWLGPPAYGWPQDAHDAAGIAWTVRELNDRALKNGLAVDAQVPGEVISAAAL